MILLDEGKLEFGVAQVRIRLEQFKKNKIGWKKSFLDGFSQDDNGSPLPWMTYSFIEFIENKLDKNQQIFEYGSGSSTLFFAKKVKKVVALESNPRWFAIVQNMLLQHDIKNVELVLMTDALENPLYENFAKNHSEKFDFIFVDSLKRFNCSLNSISALKPEGALVLDDSERKNYQKIFNFFAENNFQKQDFFGIAPGQIKMKNTTVFWN